MRLLAALGKQENNPLHHSIPDPFYAPALRIGFVHRLCATVCGSGSGGSGGGGGTGGSGGGGDGSGDGVGGSHEVPQMKQN